MKRKLVAALAAPVGFYTIAAAIMTIAYAAWGVPVEGDRAMIGSAVQGMPAAQAGLHTGDEIVGIDGAPVDMRTVASMIQRGGERVSVEVIRDGAHLVVDVAPIRDGDARRIGIELLPTPAFARASFFTALRQGMAFPPRCGAAIASAFKDLFIGRRNADVVGPVGIVRVVQRQAKRGARPFLELLAVLSVYGMLFSLLAAPILLWRVRRGQRASSS